MKLMNFSWKRQMITLILGIALILSVAAIPGCANEPTFDENPFLNDSAAGQPKDVASTDEDIAPPQENESEPEQPDEPEPEQPDEPEPEQTDEPLADFPVVAGEGKEIRFLTLQESVFCWNQWQDVMPLSGILLEQELYERNQKTESHADVVIVEQAVPAQKFRSTMYVPIMAGEPSHEACIVPSSYAGFLFFQEGGVRNLRAMPSLELDAPWWSDSANDAYAIGDRLYFAVPSLLLRDKMSTVAIFYNTEQAAALSLGDLCGEVVTGQWTLEYMISLAESTAAQMNGGVAVCGGEEVFSALYAGTGRKLATTDTAKNFVLLYGEGDTTDVAQTIFDTLLSRPFYRTENFSVRDAFLSGQALFAIDYLANAPYAGELNGQYVILPMPKWDEAQEEYFSFVSPTYDSVLAIPTTVWGQPEEEIVGATLSLMSRISHCETVPRLVELLAGGQSEPQFGDMIELVLESRCYDLGNLGIFEGGVFSCSHLLQALNKSAAESDFDAERPKYFNSSAYRSTMESFKGLIDRLAE